MLWINENNKLMVFRKYFATFHKNKGEHPQKLPLQNWKVIFIKVYTDKYLTVIKYQNTFKLF